MYMLKTGLTARKRAYIRDGKTVKMTGPEAILGEVEDVADSGQEVMVVLTLNSRNKLIDKHVVTIGILDASLVHPREVFRVAIADNAAAIVLVHNHPSGDVAPSAEDIRITKQMVEAGKIVDIKVLDHVVVARSDETDEVVHMSMREDCIVSF